MRSLVFLSLFVAYGSFAQVYPEKEAMRRMERKAKWPKLEQALRKSVLKDSINPESHYQLALYFFSPANPSQNFDSAYRYSGKALRDLSFVVPKERDRLRRIPLDSAVLVRLSASVDSAAFENAKSSNTESAYQHFIDQHKSSRQRHAAIELRDEVAFLDALKTNTWGSFQKFIIKYPSSHRETEAKERYEKLLYEEKTSDRRLSSYIKFIDQFPLSPYRGNAEMAVFELSTASGSVESFRWFIDHYPSAKSSRVALNILYGLQTTDEDESFDDAGMIDSLRSVEKLNRSYWVPVFKSGKYGFIDDLGAEVLAPSFESISSDYRCGDVRDKVLVTSSGLIARDGKVLWKGKIDEAKEIGFGYLLLTADSARYVIHESGFTIGSKIHAAQPISGRFIGLEKNNKWALYGLAGQPLLPFVYDGITSLDSLIVLTKAGKKLITVPSKVARVSERFPLAEELIFDDVKRWGSQQYWVRNGLLEGVVDANLNFIIPLDRHQLQKTSFGFLRAKDGSVFVKGVPKFENIAYKSIQAQAGWIDFQTKDDTRLLYDRGLDRVVPADSIWFQGQMAFVRKKDSISVFLPSGLRLPFHKTFPFQIKEYLDSMTWLVIDDRKKKVIYDAVSGAKLFAMEFDQLEAMSPDIFLVTSKNKKGLVNEDGKVLVPVEYDAIAASESGGFSLLKDRKFGWYDTKKKQLIKPLFDRNIKSYGNGLHVAFREKGYGFIHSDGKPAGTFDAEEIRYWNDSTAWIKRKFQWMLTDVHSQKVKLDRIRNYTVIKDGPEEKVYIIRQDNAFGVISSKRGIIVPIQYSDIINLGNKDVQLYFTERHIEEAGISVVIYYDHQGKIIRKQAMEAEEFDKIVCDD